MYTATAPELAALADPESERYMRVEYENPDNVLVDLDTLGSTKWVDSWVIDESIEAPIPNLTLSLRREHGNESLAPLLETSPLNVDAGLAYAPFLDAGRRVLVYTACIPKSAGPPVAGDFKLMGDFETDTIRFGRSTVTVNARDRIGAELMDSVIEAETQYGGKAIELVMQDIINAWTPGGIAVIMPGGPPGFVTNLYNQQPSTVWDALDTLRLLIGWDLRPKWNNGTGQFELVFEEPNRNAVTPDYIYTPAQYLDVPNMDLDRTSIRNRIVVHFLDSGTGLRDSVTYDNAASQAAYKLRPMVITEPDDSPINTIAEANTLANAVGADLSTPDVTKVIEDFLFWPVQVGDYLGFAPNGVHYSNQQNYGVVGSRKSYANGNIRSVISTRGKPAAAFSAWRKLKFGTEIDRAELDVTATDFNWIPVPDLAFVDLHLIECSFAAGPRVVDVEVGFSYSNGLPPSDPKTYLNVEPIGDRFAPALFLQKPAIVLNMTLVGIDAFGNRGNTLTQRFVGNEQAELFATDQGQQPIEVSGMGGGNYGAYKTVAGSVAFPYRRSALIPSAGEDTTAATNWTPDIDLGSRKFVTLTANTTLDGPPLNWTPGDSMEILFDLGVFQLTVDGAAYNTNDATPQIGSTCTVTIIQPVAAAPLTAWVGTF